MNKDTNYRSYVGETGTTVTKDNWTPVVDPSRFDDILKASNCTRFTVDGLMIRGGREDCIDAVRGADYRFINLELSPEGRNGITVKGAVDGWLVEAVLFWRHGRECDIEIGQHDIYWTPGRPPTRNGAIVGVRSLDGKPVVVRLWDATMPEIVNSDVKVVRVPKIIWFPYFLYRYLTS